MHLCKKYIVMNISLIGYMGSGKTTVGKILAKQLGRTFIDLDHFIENAHDRTIPEIFREKGEIGFRKIEREMLENLLQKENIILSLGGGTPAYYNNMHLINQLSHSVYLQTPLNELTERLCKNKEQRPLLLHLEDDELAEYIAKHLFERRAFYEQAHTHFKTQQMNPQDVALLLIEHLRYQKILPK